MAALSHLDVIVAYPGKLKLETHHAHLRPVL